MGSPMSAISVTCLSKNPSGGVSAMGSEGSTSSIRGTKSGRDNLTVAAKLLKEDN